MNSIDDELLDRYVSGECSQEESASVLQWAGNNPERHARIARARALPDAAHALNDHWDVDRAWARAQSVMRSAEPEARRGPAAPPFDEPDVDPEPGSADVAGARGWWRGRTQPTVAAAACLALAIGIAAWRILDTRRPFVSAPESIVTGPRQRVSMQLRDGSRVILGPESHLVEAAQFGARTRQITLEGAAYFDVVHDPSRPFVVAARNVRIRDLGTRFAVDAYAQTASAQDSSEGASARVAVAAGSVAIEAVSADTVRREGSSEVGTAPATPIIVSAGSVGRIDTHGHISVDQPKNLSPYVSWTSGTLTLEDVPLSEAVRQMEHWYGVTITIADPALACRHITTAFHDDPLPDALDELSLALHLRHVESGGSVMLTTSDGGPGGQSRSVRPPGGLDACDGRSGSPVGRRE